MCYHVIRPVDIHFIQPLHCFCSWIPFWRKQTFQFTFKQIFENCQARGRLRFLI